MIHLPTGRRTDTYLSPAYLDYGLWNLVDFEKGVVYHHGLGMDPGRYRFSEPHNIYRYGNLQTVETSLVAVPLALPE